MRQKKNILEQKHNKMNKSLDQILKKVSKSYRLWSW